MPLDVPGNLRRLLMERAGNRCEYCLLPQWAALHKHELDHIVSTQHGGETDEDNLALSCMRCNRYKGPNVGSIDPLTPEGRVTVKILRLNDEDRVFERNRLIEIGLFGIE